MRRRTLLGAGLAAGWALASPLRAQPAAGPLPVVASFSILGDLLRRIGGDRLAVQVLVGPDADAHDFQPRPAQAAALREARLVLRNGLDFEPWLDRLLAAAGGQARLVTAAQGVTPRRLPGGHDHSHGGAGHRHDQAAMDPHAWQDLRNGQIYVRNIAEGLSAIDPDGAPAYLAKAAALQASLASLDGWVRDQVQSVPEARRRVVTSHDAFGYFGAAYGIRFSAPQGVSTQDEPSAAEIARLIRQLRAQGTTALFLENMSNPALMDRLAREAGVRVRGRLYADALSPPDGPAPSYEAMFRHNIGLLVPAMRGDA